MKRVCVIGGRDKRVGSPKLKKGCNPDGGVSCVAICKLLSGNAPDIESDGFGNPWTDRSNADLKMGACAPEARVPWCDAWNMCPPGWAVALSSMEVADASSVCSRTRSRL